MSEEDAALPEVKDEYFTEREGVLEVARKVNRLRCIWRETPNADLGIDGQIEHLNAQGKSTGHLVAVQVKSGSSYLRKHRDSIVFYPQEKHRNYWERFPIPVIVVIYDPDSDTAYWQDVRQQLRSPRSQEHRTIRIPLHQTLDLEHRDQLFETCGALQGRIMSVDELLAVMIRARTRNAGFDLSFFDLFINGLTDIARKLFFSMQLCMEIAEFKLAVVESELGVGLGSEEYEFIDAYIKLIVSQNLTLFDFSDYLIDLREREMTPVFLNPLTSRGRELVRYIHDVEARVFSDLADSQRFPGTVACERFLGMVFTPSDYLRWMRIEEFKKRALSEAPESGK